MKVKIAVASLLIFLIVGVGSAEAGRWYMPYRQAVNATREFAAESCKGYCVASTAGPCRRFSSSRFDCVMVHLYAFLPPPPAEEAEEVECHTLLHWGVNYRGRVVLKGTSKPRCFYV